MKNVITWEPKRAEKRKPDETFVAGEYVGKLRTKVEKGTPGARNYSGTLANGKTYDYWGLDVDSVAGKLRWIDKQDGGDFGTNLVLFLESEKYLHKITIKYDPYNLKDVMNHLCGLGKEVGTRVINLSYWVRKAQKADKSFKVKDDGSVIWNKSISFRDITPQFSFEEWKVFAQENGLEWTQVKKANGSKEWNSDAEYKYWDSRLVGIQRFLLKSGTALPFCYNSMTACEAENPSGGGNLTAEEIEQCKAIYERIKGEYKFPYNRTEVSADDAFEYGAHIEQEARVEYIEQAKPLPHPDEVLFGSDPGPAYTEPQPAGDDLPF